jgi:aspartyl-tRNA(Asn)/glutamyl-tRNA(Gln) amidotransferase subunit C
MPLDPATVRRIAKLARIRLADEEVGTLQSELNAILGYVEQLGAVDVEGVQPLSGGAQMALRLRDDVVDDGGKPDAILANAPARAGNFFTVPKVVE